jgi:N-acetylglucosaminyl-diphospho-decaprenol L-rhamnosyltransferase
MTSGRRPPAGASVGHNPPVSQQRCDASASATATRPSTETVAVVVVTFNSVDLIPDLVSALPRALEGIDWHLVVADNDSRDGTVAEVRRLAPAATVVEMGRNAGYAAGVNAGVAAASEHTAILVLNPDVRPAAGCVRDLLVALRTQGTGIAVPHLVNGEGVLIPSLRREPTTLRTLVSAVIGNSRAGRIGKLGEIVTDNRRYTTETVTDWAEG